MAGSGPDLHATRARGQTKLPSSEWVQKEGKFGLTERHHRRAWKEVKRIQVYSTQLKTSLLRTSYPDLNCSTIGLSIGKGGRPLSVCARARPITNLIPDPDRILSYKSRPKRSRGASKLNKTLTLLLASVITYRVHPYISQMKKKSEHLITTLIGP